MTGRVVGGAGTALAVAALVLAARIVGYDAAPPDATADAALVLGAAVWGNEPSPVFAARLDHALALYRSGRVGRVLLTGGAAPAGRAESAVGRDHLVARGVRPADLAVEDRSRTTWQNLVCLRDTLAGPPPSVLVVSDPYHLRRAVGMARDLGFDARPAPTPTTRYRSWRSKGPFLVREVYFAAVDAVARALGARGGCPPG